MVGGGVGVIGVAVTPWGGEDVVDPPEGLDPPGVAELSESSAEDEPETSPEEAEDDEPERETEEPDP